ncbi:MAG TPA: glycosyltransferase [Terriglobales bacterium]|jgi:glycosyltransferase involved in cell wall biosynthesis|nr:glycosyltransferase [Terriglobales bacterium]
MNTSQELTIVIPAKNEAELLPRLLESIAQQDSPGMRATIVYVADAQSTDGTPDLALGFRDRIDVRVIPGGLPSAGRNAGARMATTPYVLFLDADMELADNTLVRRALELAKRKNLHCVTTNIWCRDGRFMDQVMYLGNDIVQQFSRLLKPFSTGMFMLFNRERFEDLGGFNEQALYAEDYLLSKKVARRKFGIAGGKALTTNRRFKKMGHIKIMGMFFRTALNSWNDNYFLRDHHYWHS